MTTMQDDQTSPLVAAAFSRADLTAHYGEGRKDGPGDDLTCRFRAREAEDDACWQCGTPYDSAEDGCDACGA